MRIGGVICDCILSAFNAIIVVLVEAVFLMNYIKKIVVNLYCFRSY